MKKTTGFTLIELIVTIAVFAIAAAMAIPNLNSFIDSNRRAANINTFVSAMNLARSEAVKRNNDISVCVRNDAGTDCDAAKNWENGWLVFVDDGVKGDVNGSDVILRVYDPIFKRTTPLDVSFRETEANIKFITYQYKGNTNTIATFRRCDYDAAGNGAVSKARAVIVSLSGRTRLSKDSNDDGTHEGRINTTNLTCP